MAQEILMAKVMTANPYFIEAGASLNSAKIMMRQINIRHLPVKDGDKPVGVISERDLKMAEQLGMDSSIGTESRVKDICNRDVHIVNVDEPLRNVLLVMADKRCDYVLVTNAGKLAGIFTTTDVCRRYADTLAR